MPLLDIVEGACKRLLIAKPSGVVGSTDPNVRLMFALVDDECEEAAERHDWSVLKRASTFTAGAPVNGVVSFTWPTDFGRMGLDAQFTRTASRQMVFGPISSRDWADMTTGVASVTGSYWRPYGNGIQVFGVTVGETIGYDYITKNRCTSSIGTEQSTFQSDTDKPFLPERLIRLGVVYRWRQVKALDYAEDMASYERELERVTSLDGGLGIVSTGFGDLDRPPLSLPTINPARP